MIVKPCVISREKQPNFKAGNHIFKMKKQKGKISNLQKEKKPTLIIPNNSDVLSLS